MNQPPRAAFLAITSIVALFLVFGCATTSKFAGVNGLPIVQGLTNSHATQFSIIAPRDLSLEFYFGIDTLSRVYSHVVSTKENKANEVVAHHLVLDNLKLGENYVLEVREAQKSEVHGANSSPGRVIDRRHFKTLDLSPHPARVIAASCLYDYFLKESVEMWKAVIAAKPDLLLLIGDNVYAEISNGRFPSPLNEAALWTRYTETFQVLDFYKTPQLIPTVVTWDDHDYGMQDGNRENPYKLESKKVLEAFFAQEATPAFSEFSTGPGVSSRLDAFGYRFLLLDDRSFRTPPNVADDEESHFGSEQENWIRQRVFETKNPVWLISGDQWFGAYHRFESYEGRHPNSFRRFLKTFRDARGRAPTLIFMSGDRHLSEINRIEPAALGYETFEITSSSLHSKPHPANWDTIPNKRQVRGIDMHHAFTLLELTPPDARRTVHLKGQTIGTGSTLLYDFDFEIKREKPRP